MKRMSGLIVIAGGLALAAWVSFGRYLFGVGGELTPWFAVGIGVPIAALYFFVGRAIMRTARFGRRTRPSTVVMLVISVACGILLGFMIPDVTPLGLQTILSGPAEPGLSVAVGVANPLGVVCLAAAIAALVLAHGDTKERIVVEED